MRFAAMLAEVINHKLQEHVSAAVPAWTSSNCQHKQQHPFPVACKHFHIRIIVEQAETLRRLVAVAKLYQQPNTN